MLIIRFTLTEKSPSFFDGKGTIALINTPNQTYPGMNFAIGLSNDKENIIFNQIFSTFKFSK